MIKLNRNEADELVKIKFNRRLRKSGSSKKHKRKNYYVENDDFITLKTIAEIRNCSVSDLTDICDNDEIYY